MRRALDPADGLAGDDAGLYGEPAVDRRDCRSTPLDQEGVVGRHPHVPMMPPRPGLVRRHGPGSPSSVLARQSQTTGTVMPLPREPIDHPLLRAPGPRPSRFEPSKAQQRLIRATRFVAKIVVHPDIKKVIHLPGGIVVSVTWQVLAHAASQDFPVPKLEEFEGPSGGELLALMDHRAAIGPLTAGVGRDPNGSLAMRLALGGALAKGAGLAETRAAEDDPGDEPPLVRTSE
jgi:hypothetical protein